MEYKIIENSDLNSVVYKQPPHEVIIHFLGVASEEEEAGEIGPKREDLEYLDVRTLIKLHGIFMVIAWMGTTTIGVIIAR